MNSATGYSPYALLFGRDPKLPVDFLLGNNFSNDSEVVLDEWIAEHQSRLRYAHEKAGEQIKDRVLYRKEQHDKRRFNPEIRVGDSVYIRNRGVYGRNKIQDTWDSTVYRVIKTFENTVVVVPSDGAGVSRTLNRQHVLKCRSDSDEPSSKDSSDNEDDGVLVVPRRRFRVTAGKHSNPNKLPCSTLNT